jgi:hypothetical protein
MILSAVGRRVGDALPDTTVSLTRFSSGESLELDDAAHFAVGDHIARKNPRG